MRVRALHCLMLLLFFCPPAARAASAPDLSGRIVIDGFTGDFMPGESVFGLAANGWPMEPSDDSRWFNNDVSQIRVTWDRQAVYLGVEGIIWGNNMVLLLDVVADRGITTMTTLNSWRRNVSFSPEFGPDLFLGTWDANLAPRLIVQLAGNQVSDNMPGPLFSAAASFDQGATGRAMEARIPWTTVFAGATRDTLLDEGGLPVPATLVPARAEVHLAAMVVAGWDGSSGPDVAPNNSTGLSSDAGALAVIDNFAIVPLDLDGDALPDMGVEPIARVSFHDVSTPARSGSWGRLKALYR